MEAVNWLGTLKILAVLGCGLVAGVFFAFSTFVMSALARLPEAQGLAAMQSINITVINPLFMTAFLGTGIVSGLLLIFGATHKYHPGMGLMIAGGAIYIVGTIFTTFFYNVPLNDALASAKPGTVEGTHLWHNYLVQWTAWNHIRTVSSLIAAGAFLVGLYQRQAG
jgi:uncharacterized membrane protein